MTQQFDHADTRDRVSFAPKGTIRKMKSLNYARMGLTIAIVCAIVGCVIAENPHDAGEYVVVPMIPGAEPMPTGISVTSPTDDD